MDAVHSLSVSLPGAASDLGAARPDFAIVERPDPYRLPVYDAIASTVESGQAVRVPLGGRSFHALRNAVYRAMGRRGIDGHARRDGDWMIAWATTRALAVGMILLLTACRTQFVDGEVVVKTSEPVRVAPGVVGQP